MRSREQLDQLFQLALLIRLGEWIEWTVNMNQNIDNDDKNIILWICLFVSLDLKTLFYE